MWLKPWALFSVALIGFPQEILSDQGSDFMSEIMQVFLNEFSVHHIRYHPYHPQSNGA